MRKKTSKIILLFLCICVLSFANEIDNFNALLPTAYHPINGHAKQLITTSGGCYDWQSATPNIVSVNGLSLDNTNCNPYGVIQVKQLGPYRGSIYLSVTSKKNEETTTIPVRLRDLHRISIFTKAKTMNLKEIQNIEIKGFDSENNTFTSLEGLTFKWQILNEDGELTKIPLNQASLYMHLDTRKKLELKGQQSDYLVVQALKVGIVKIRARCLQEKYTLIQDQVTVYVQEKFQIVPCEPLTILAGSSYQLYLKTPSEKNITLPAPQYLITVENGFMITDQMLITAPLYDSSTVLNVSDRRTLPYFSANVEVSCIEPDRIEIICPQQIIIGKSVIYKIQYYHQNQLLKGKPNRFQLDISQGFVLNQKDSTISALRKKKGEITFRYNGLSARKQITSVTPVQAVLPTKGLVVLPAGQTYQLRIIGGSGLYRYQVESRELAKISYNGVITTKNQGETFIKVFDEKNQNNFVSVQLIIASVGKIGNFEVNKESNINQLFSLFISGIPRTSKQAYFTQCNDAVKRISLRSSVSTGIFQQISIYGATTETLSQLKNQASTNKIFQKTLEKHSILPKSIDEIIKQFDINIRERDISENQLREMIQEMENYGICSKLIYKGLAAYDDKLVILSGQVEPLYVNMRVYPQLKTVFKTIQKDPYAWVNSYNLLNNKKQITMTPKSNFVWYTEGGSYAWKEPTKTYLNGVYYEIGKEKYPAVQCPNSPESSVNKYLLEMRNPITEQLLRPVSQDEELTIICEMPSRIRTTVLSKLPLTTDSSLTSYLYKPNKDIHTTQTIFLHPHQNFVLLVEPITSAGIPFYNSSNTDYSIRGKQLKLGEIHSLHLGKNYRFYEYNTQNRRESDLLTDDLVLIKALGTRTVKYTQEQENAQRSRLQEQFLVKILEKLQITFEEEGGDLILPNHPSNIRTIPISKPDRPYRLKCYDQSLVTAWKDNQNNIKLQPKGNSGRTAVQIIDDLVIGSPAISLPVRVFQPSGIQLRIVPDPTKKRESASKTKTWMIEGESILLGLLVYASDSHQGRQDRMIIKNINPEDIVISFQLLPLNNPQLREVSRYYNKDTQQIMVRYFIPSITKNLDYSRISFNQNKQGLLYTIKGKLNKYPLISNEAQLRVFRPVFIQGGHPLLTKDPSALDFEISIINSCKKSLQILGGPPDLKTMVIKNLAQNSHHKISKIEESLYQIEALKENEGTKSVTNINRKQINGEQYNLVVIAINYDGCELGFARFLVNVEKIGNFGIYGLSNLILGKQTRILTEADNIGMINALSCEFKFNWKNEGDAIMITSDPFKNAVNITAIKNGESTVQITVTNQNNKLLGRAFKKIQVIHEYEHKYFEDADKNVILMPPNSAIQFPEDTRIEELSSCDQQNSDITILGSNQIRSGPRISGQAQILKISSYSRPNELAIYFNLLVTKICALAIQNQYGSLSVHRDIPEQFSYYLMDCYGRKFSHRLLNIDYKVSVADPDIAHAEVSSVSNTLKVEGYKIGTTMLLLEITNQEESIRDVIPITVNIFIEPSKAINVHLGDQIYFRANTNSDIEWESSNLKGLAINRNSGKAVALIDGQYSIKFGNMETKVSVTKLIDIIKSTSQFTYSPVYSNHKELTQHTSIIRNLKWTCEILGPEARYFTANAKYHINPETSLEQIICQLQRTSSPPPEKFSNFIEIQISGLVRSKFQYYKKFVEPLNADEFFLIITDKKIEPSTITGIYYVIVEAKQRLQVYQKGGKDEWVQKNQYNGVKQVITLDFTSQESRAYPWELHLFNPKTSQRQIIKISSNEERESESSEDPDEWKWTDILVLFMGVNFCAICLYQVYSNRQSNPHEHTY